MQFKDKEKLMNKVINKQFEIAGLAITLDDIPDDWMVTVNKKKIPWYEHYKFENIQQYETWRAWAEKEFEKEGYNGFKEMAKLDMQYGMMYRYTKIGELF